MKKKLRVIGDWAMEFIFHSDVSMIKGYVEEKFDNDLDNRNNKNMRDESTIDIGRSKLGA